MIVPGMFVCSSFLISVCMFIVSKALLISSATVIVRAGGAIWLNPFATVLFNVCSAVTVECCVLYPCCMGVFGMFAVMWLTSGRASGRKTLLQYSSLTPLERECYEEEVQPYWKTDYKPIIYILSVLSSCESSLLSKSYF